MRRTRRTIMGLILGVLAGAGFVMVPGLLAQPSNGFYYGPAQPGPLVPARLNQLYGISQTSPVGLILVTLFLIFLAAIAVSLLTRNLTMTKVTRSQSAQNVASTSEASDHS